TEMATKMDATKVTSKIMAAERAAQAEAASADAAEAAKYICILPVIVFVIAGASFQDLFAVKNNLSLLYGHSGQKSIVDTATISAKMDKNEDRI
ncbi:MAG: hypothetical protein RRY95_08845, partial [Oscillospiraceae bacterium]